MSFLPTTGRSTCLQTPSLRPLRLIKRAEKVARHFFHTHKRTDMNKEQVKGVAQQGKGKGKVKEVTGDLTGKKSLEGEGDQVKGKVRKSYGDAKENVKDGIDNL
jgi:uncharacterized protein YjbJ (UPF0337 family)